MSPPQLARDAPVVDIAHPVKIDLPEIFRNNRNLARLDGLLRAISQRFDLDEPLFRQSRFHDSSTAVALSERQRVILFSNEKALLFQVMQHALARLKAVE